MPKFIDIPEFHREYASLKGESGVLFLDVRRPDEFASGHVPGSVNVPHEEVTAHLSMLQSKKTVYLYCRSGGRVQMACQALEMAGLKNLVGVINGGMPDWVAAGFEVER